MGQSRILYIIECLLTEVHSLWGNPKHLSYVATALRQKYAEDRLHILVATSNSDTFTYDGIDVGGERVAQEIEDEMKELALKGHKLKKLSMVGYSLGGLVARYTIGLLYSRGWFDKIDPVNFTTFATPHLGVRTPLRGYHSRIWNALGSRTLSTSGRQLFLIDSFRDTGRPILSVLADPSSIFVKALTRFRHRVLYANVINDRSAPYYTTAITQYDPFVDPGAVQIEYAPNYEPIILARDRPVRPIKQDSQPSFYTRLISSGHNALIRLPYFALLSILVPIGTVAFLINSGIQSFRSSHRIRLHEEGKAGVGFDSYRIPLLAETAHSAIDSTIESVSAGQRQEYLPDNEGSSSRPESTKGRSSMSEDDQLFEKRESMDSTTGLARTISSTSEFPTLALAPEQFAMIQTLNEIGFRKYPVYIHNVNHSHAAIVVRMSRSSFDEGKVVVRHWLMEEFEI